MISNVGQQQTRTEREGVSCGGCVDGVRCHHHRRCHPLGQTRHPRPAISLTLSFTQRDTYHQSSGTVITSARVTIQYGFNGEFPTGGPRGGVMRMMMTTSSRRNKGRRRRRRRLLMIAGAHRSSRKRCLSPSWRKFLTVKRNYQCLEGVQAESLLL